MQTAPPLVRCLVLSTAILASAALTLRSQERVLFQRLIKDHVTNPEEFHNAVIGDFDGDGDLDVMHSGGRLIHNHIGRFVPFPFRFSTIDRPLRTADFDGDGKDDLIDLPSFNLQNFAVALNRMPFLFRRQEFPFLPSGAVDALAVADFDGDGDLDIVVSDGRPYNPMYQLVNDGTGVFVDGTATRMPTAGPRYEGAWPLDADGDGDVDLVIRDGSTGLAIMVNQGGGVLAAPNPNSIPAGPNRVLEILDLDADGDQDLITNRGVLLNNQAAFTPATPDPLPEITDQTSHVRMADFDRDGDLDAWIEYTVVKLCRWYENPGNGGAFVTPQARVPVLRRDSDDVAITDIDGDGQLDVLSVGDRIGALLGQPGGDFLDMAPEAPVAPVYGDFNGDGFTDSLFITGFFQLFLRRNDGVGGFTEQAAIPGFTVVDLSGHADVDGDGDRDLLVRGPYPGFSTSILLNDGTGRFQDLPGAMPRSVRDVNSTRFEDLDGDGDQDLMAYYGQFGSRSTAFLRNDGTGVFTIHSAWNIPALQGLELVYTMLDADGDGDVDLIAGYDDPILYRNDGTGQMVAVPGAIPLRFATASVRPASLCPADIDQDGDVDFLAVYDYRIAYSGPDDGALFENDGTGTFTIADLFTGPVDWIDGALVDVDDDAVPEMVVSSYQYSGVAGVIRKVEIYENDGSGTLILGSRVVEGPTTLSGYGTTPEPAQWVDADADGDMDVVGGTPRPGVFANLTRQLRSRIIPRLGGTIELEVPNPGRGGRVAFVLVSAARLAQPLSIPGWGRVIPDPAVGSAMLVSESFSQRPLRLSVPVPNIPALAGLQVYAQALVDPGLPTPKLTNAIVETLAF